MEGGQVVDLAGLEPPDHLEHGTRVRDVDRRRAAGVAAPGPAAPVLDRAIRLVVPAAVAGELAAAELGAAPIEPWGGTIREQLVGRLDALTSVGPAGFRGPTIEELRVIGDAILPRLFDLSAGGAPTPWDRAIAALVGYRFVAIGDGELPEAFALVETASDRRGHPTVVVRVRPSSAGAKVASRGTVVEVPAPRWEVGVAGAGTAVFEAIDADALLLAGSLPNADAFGGADPRRADSRRSVFHRVHELWLGSGGSAVSLQGIAPERAVAVDAVVSFGAEMFDRTQEPAWSLPLRALLDDLGLAVRVYDGTRELAPFSGAPDVALAYAKRFAEGQCAIVYLSPAIREAFARADRDRSLEPRLTRSGVKVRRADVVARAGDLARCVDPKACEADHCELDAVERSIEAYTGQGNPFDLRSGLRDPGACFVEVARDTVTGRIFAIAARRGEARVLPLAIGATRRAVGPFGPAARSRSVADVGIFPLRVAEAP